MTAEQPALRDRSIGDIIRDSRNLSAEQVQKVLDHQRSHGLRFGEAAVALGYVSTEDVMFALAQQFHYPYAAEDQVGHSDELITLKRPFSHEAEAFRAIRAQVMMRMFSDGKPPLGLAIVSPVHGDGRSYFAANLAITLAQLGGRTLLVDADMRQPRQHQIFGVSNEAGLSGILAGRSENKVIQLFRPVPALYVLPVGVTPPNPAELVERQAFALLMRELSTKFDHIVVDSPAACLGSDASVIAARCGAAFMIGRKDSTPVAGMRALADDLAVGSTRLGGVVINEH